ncbi:hypothetical protein D3C71_1245970 [compost metagenome]
MGPVSALIDIPQLQANIFVHPLDFVKTKAAYKGRAGFTNCISFLTKHKKRNQFIIDWVLKDLAAGHNLVIPVYRKEHVWELVKMINDQFGRKVADGFTGGAANKADIARRKQVLDEAKSGKIRVVIGIRSLMQRGLNVPRWSMIYCVMPINNEPNWKQESSRILTPFEGKRPPGIRFFVDENIGMPLGCFVATYKQSMKFKHKPTDIAHERAIKLMEKHNSKRGGGRGEASDGFMDDTKAVRVIRSSGRPFGD